MDGLDVICYAHWGPCLSSPPLDEHITHAAHANNYSKKSLYIKWRCFADSCLYSAWCHADIFDAELKSDYINGINLMY